MKTIGSKIKRLRLDNNLTQDDLADKIEVNFTTVSLYESDNRKPSYKVLYRIAEVFDVPPAFFIDSKCEEEIKDENILLAMKNMQKLSAEDIEVINSVINALLKKYK